MSRLRDEGWHWLDIIIWAAIILAVFYGANGLFKEDSNIPCEVDTIGGGFGAEC